MITQQSFKTIPNDREIQLLHRIRRAKCFAREHLELARAAYDSGDMVDAARWVVFAKFERHYIYLWRRWIAHPETDRYNPRFSPEAPRVAPCPAELAFQ